MSKPIPDATTPSAAAAAPADGAPASADDLPYHGTPEWMHHASVAAAVLAPVGLLLPPRRMGARNLMLAAGTFLATSQVAYDYTGQSLYQRFQSRLGRLATASSELPEGARARQAAMQAERARRERAAAGQPEASAPTETETDKKDGTLHRIWMGKEKEDWVRERARQEKEMLESGQGYSGIILGQIAEVWTDLWKKKEPAPKEGEAPAETDAAAQDQSNKR